MASAILDPLGTLKLPKVVVAGLNLRPGDRVTFARNTYDSYTVTKSPGSRVLLHDEIAAILRAAKNRWMTTKQLADAVNRRGRYEKRDGSVVTPFQIHGRTRNYSDLFERDGARVRMRT